jgi:hypothetical protein
MAYNEELESRVEIWFEQHAERLEMKKMFGGLCWLKNGNMALGANGDNLIIRMDPEYAETRAGEDGVGRFDMTGKTMKGWLTLGPEAWEDEETLSEWIEIGLSFAGSLPPK